MYSSVLTPNHALGLSELETSVQYLNPTPYNLDLGMNIDA
jgi:hypothetical protein